MAAEGIADAAPPENIVITAGSQSAQDVATKVFCNPGDVVLVENPPTYVGALNTFEAYQVQVEPIEMDDDGLVPELLEARIAALQAEGKNIKFLYTIPPNFNNPSGITLAAERRQQIVDICRSANIIVLEDNPYGLLRFDGHPIARCEPPTRMTSSIWLVLENLCPPACASAGPGSHALAASFLPRLRGSDTLPASPESNARLGIPP